MNSYFMVITQTFLIIIVYWLKVNIRKDENNFMKKITQKITLKRIQEKIVTYQVIVMLSFVFGVLGFIYNNWRYEHNEYNNNIRIASFQMIQELASLEQIIYANHYDKDLNKGNPRDGWVKVGLINDLSFFISPETIVASTELENTWSMHWQKIHSERNVTNLLVSKIEDVRKSSRDVLQKLY